MAQFFGHTHFDEYEVFYDNVNFTRPLSIGYISPSVTPWENVNPSYRIYYVDDSNTETKGVSYKIDNDNTPIKKCYSYRYFSLGYYRPRYLEDGSWQS